MFWRTHELEDEFNKIYDLRLDEKSRQEYTDSEFISCFLAEGNRIKRRSDVEREVGCSKSTAWRRLENLVEDGLLYSEKVGKAKIYMLQVNSHQPATIAGWKKILNNIYPEWESKLVTC